MRKMKTGCFILAVMCMLTACGKNQTDEPAAVSENSPDNQKGTEQSTQTDNETLAGVFQDGSSLISVPMGTNIDGAQQQVCQIEIPENYLIYGSYTETEEVYRDFDGVYNVLVREAYEDNAWENEMQMSGCTLTSTEGDPVTKLEVYVNEGVFDEIIPADNYTDLEGKEYRTVYCESDDALSGTDLEVYIMASEQSVISVYYEGPLSDEMDAGQLADNIYELFEITG